MILCPDTDLADALRRRMEAMVLPAIGTRTCSFGVAEFLPGETVGRLLVRVDEALYAAKRNGRNRVEVADGGVARGRRSAARRITEATGVRGAVRRPADR